MPMSHEMPAFETSEHLDSLDEAYRTTFRYHDDNERMLRRYVGHVLADMKARPIGNLLSLGIGHRVVTTAILKAAEHVDSYTVIEGSPSIIEGFTNDHVLPGNISIKEGFFEKWTPDRMFDSIEMGFVLEHVVDPALIVRRYRDFLTPDGVMHIAVPNARSLHRLLGHHAGMLDDLYALNDHDRQLGHRHYFDLASITALVQEAGLDVTASHGLLLKPLTSGQLELLSLPDEVYEAMCIVGDELPGHCNGMYLRAEQRHGEE